MSTQTPPAYEAPAGPPPTPPGKRRRMKGWYRALIALAVLIMVGIIATAAGGCAPTPTATEQPQATATLKPQPTATPSGPQPVTGALLGGPINDFTQAFGSPTSTVPGATQYQTDVRGIPVFLAAATTDRKDTTTNSRVDQVVVRPPLNSGVTWTAAQGEAIAKTFMPPDAKYVKDATVTVPEGAILEHVYISARLAASFPADRFYDVTSLNPVAPGTFHYQCGGPYERDGSCLLQLGV